MLVVSICYWIMSFKVLVSFVVIDFVSGFFWIFVMMLIFCVGIGGVFLLLWVKEWVLSDVSCNCLFS